MKKAMLVAALLLSAFASNVGAQPAKDAVRAFAKLDAKLDTGISYRDYVSALGDVNFELKSFTDSADARKYPEVQRALESAMLRYSEAKEMWGLTFGRSKIEYFAQDSKLGRSYLSRYPEAARHPNAGGAVLAGDVSIKYLMPHLWKDASQLVAGARRLLATE